MSKKSKKKQRKHPLTIEELKKSGVTIYALIYCRVSSERQKLEGNGLGSQEQRCREYAIKNGFVVDKVFADASSGGGAYTTRLGQVELLEHIDKNPLKVFVVIVDDISRLARDVQAHFQFRLLLKERSVEVVSPNFKFEDTVEGELIEGVMAIVSQYHRQGNARQVSQKQLARLKMGCWPFPSVRPYKMTRNAEHGEILVPKYPEAKYVKEALEKFSTGEFLTQIDACKFLIEKGYWENKKVDPSKRISAFTKMAKRILYAGYVECADWDFPPTLGKHEPIISLETYAQVQKRLKREGLSTRVRRDIHPDFRLRGLVLCDGCSVPLRGGYSKGRTKHYAYYVCHSKTCEFYGKSIPKEVIDNEYRKLLAQTALSNDASKLVEIMFEKAWKEEVDNVKMKEGAVISERTSIEKKIEQLTNELLDAKSPAMKSVYEKQIIKLAESLESIELQSVEIDFAIPYRTAVNKAVGLLKSPLDYWDLLEAREQRQLFYFLFDKKIPFNKNTGYTTAKIQTATRLFEDFVAVSSTDVEMRRFELRSENDHQYVSTVRRSPFDLDVIS